MPLHQALQALGITWSPVDGAADADATQPAPSQAGGVAGAAQADGLWAIRSPGDDEAKVWERAGFLHTVGLLPSLEVGHVTSEDVALFVAAAGGNQA
eukprot:3166537-Pleurochrysis_carterae.AAC.1